MMRSIIYKLFIINMFVLFTACTGIRYLQPGEKLYTGAEIKLEPDNEIARKEKKFIEATIKEAVRTKPNKSYFGIRPKLWMYGIAGENPNNKITKWLKKTGEAPVLMSSIRPAATSSIIDAKMFNIGIFNGYTEFKISEKPQTSKLIYTSYIHEPYTINELLYAISDDRISQIIFTEKENSFIKPGTDYKLDLLKNERIRIDALLKDKGYFYFSPEYLLFKADTTAADRTVALRLSLKDSLPENALLVYRINQVLIDQNYSLKTDTSQSNKERFRFENTLFLGRQSEMEIRPKVILRSVYLRSNEIYSRKNHNITLNRLMSMGNLKFTQVKLSESDTSAGGYLDATILLTPLPKYSFRAEIEIVSKSNNYMGPRMNLSIQNRNTFRGAELLNLNMAGSFEAQLGGKTENLYSYSWNPQLELFFPFFLVPFKLDRNSSPYIPKTRIQLSYNFLKRVNYFEMSTVQAIYGYTWKKDIRQQHELNPINISYTSIGNKSALFNELLTSNPYLKKSYEEQFIPGGTYSYTYNEQVIPGKDLQYYLHVTSELGGNVLSLAKTIGGSRITSDNPSSVIGSIYSQYVRVSIDGRMYYNFINKNKIAYRLFAGIAKPYGNSSTLPYTKQFFSGGPNSIRAFQINSLGPGNYHQSADNIGFLQLGGDVKLEMNAEYRYTIFRFLKGALFTDMGNVWLLKSNPSNTGSAFSFSSFSDELAVGAGLGLRIDVSFFILRFDLATALRNPWLENNHKWVINRINFLDPTWRSENLVFNVAIGYPF